MLQKKEPSSAPMAEKTQYANTALDEIPEDGVAQNQQLQQMSQQKSEVESRPHYRTYDNGRSYPIRESRIKDRPASKGAREGSISIKIELDLEVEVDLYARVKGDVTIGLM
ncbi:uncharacterized protein LY89DRAFT_726043 [Mollisia scopiformis]|uniref:Uncharacterized protein n=1 Tax=Mollisia scopiformis TaxID=149040 RepID=A0A132B4B0_MOLSC|nr:uncharacterized protein LY89DRAFT_726043 [Mollisia scopiformis]KUJ07230.1 hypothetical protein LY89DRAFT_726043 [Mollisia scopiformis]